MRRQGPRGVYPSEAVVQVGSRRQEAMADQIATAASALDVPPGRDPPPSKGPLAHTAPERLAYLLRTLHARAGQRVAVLVDEYDKPILDALELALLATRYPSDWDEYELHAWMSFSRPAAADVHEHQSAADCRCPARGAATRAAP